MKALVYRNQRHRHTKHQRLNQTVHHIVMKVHIALHLRPKNTAVQPQILHPNQIGAVNPGHIKNRRQQRHRQHTGPKPWHHHARHRVYRHHAHGLQLLGGFHQADFTGHGTTGAAGKQNRRQHRPQFAQQACRHHIAQGIGGLEFRQLGIALQAQHHAHKQAGHGNNDDRQYPSKIHLSHAEPWPLQHRRTAQQNGQQKQHHRAELA